MPNRSLPRYERTTGRFRDPSTGRFISERSVRDGVDRMADLAARRLADTAARLRTGAIDITRFQSDLLATIKQAHVAAALAAYGGRAQMTPQRWGVVGARVRGEYQFARRMVQDILDGRQPMNGRLDVRVRLYGRAARFTYEEIRRREMASIGFAFERNVLHAAEHCRGCLNEDSRGWVQIGALLPPGRRDCRGNCRCTLAYARTYSETLAA